MADAPQVFTVTPKSKTVLYGLADSPADQIDHLVRAATSRHERFAAREFMQDSFVFSSSEVRQYFEEFEKYAQAEASAPGSGGKRPKAPNPTMHWNEYQKQAKIFEESAMSQALARHQLGQFVALFTKYPGAIFVKPVEILDLEDDIQLTGRQAAKEILRRVDRYNLLLAEKAQGVFDYGRDKRYAAHGEKMALNDIFSIRGGLVASLGTMPLLDIDGNLYVDPQASQADLFAAAEKLKTISVAQTRPDAASVEVAAPAVAAPVATTPASAVNALTPPDSSEAKMGVFQKAPPVPHISLLEPLPEGLSVIGALPPTPSIAQLSKPLLEPVAVATPVPATPAAQTLAATTPTENSLKSYKFAVTINKNNADLTKNGDLTKSGVVLNAEDKKVQEQLIEEIRNRLPKDSDGNPATRADAAVIVGLMIASAAGADNAHKVKKAVVELDITTEQIDKSLKLATTIMEHTRKKHATEFDPNEPLVPQTVVGVIPFGSKNASKS